MSNVLTERVSTFGSVRFVDFHGIKGKYVLARCERGQEAYYSGKPKKIGMATSVRVENARMYDSAREAYDDGDTSIYLNWFRAVRADTATHRDGFVSRWWMKDWSDA